MKQNKYDDIIFFDKYKQMNRSQKGLEAAGEWHVFKNTLPSLKNKVILDLGCGFGFHCQYAIEQGAKKVIGVDISKKMLELAKKNTSNLIQYHHQAIEEFDLPANSVDVIISSLTFHYIQDWNKIVEKIKKILKNNGKLIFTVEHPIFTAHGKQEWFIDDKNTKLFWPVDNYFIQGLRTTNFLGESVIKYHRTITNYLTTLLNNNFVINKFIEPTPSQEMLNTIPDMSDELRRPMMLIILATNLK